MLVIKYIHAGETGLRSGKFFLNRYMVKCLEETYLWVNVRKT